MLLSTRKGNRYASDPGLGRGRNYSSPYHPNQMQDILKARKNQIIQKGSSTHELKCDRKSVSGSVSQRACAFCGSRVVLYPIADALHLIHGPIGCAAYTWDIRGSLSSGPQLHRLSFSTDLQEKDVIFGGEPKLYKASLNSLGNTTQRQRCLFDLHCWTHRR